MEVIDILMDWEKEFGLFEKGNVRGFDFYSYLRRDLVNSAVNKKNNIATDPFKGKGQKDTGLKLFLKLLKRTEKTSVRNADMLILCHPRRNKTEAGYESVFTDYLQEEFPNSVTLERLFDDHVHFEPAITKSICYTDRITLKSYVYRILVKKFKKKEYTELKAEIRQVMDEAFTSLEKRLDVDMEKEKYYEQAAIVFYFHKIRKPLYEKFLKRVNPKLTVEVVSKSIDAMIINEICAEKGIPVVEIQHSLLGPIAKYPDGIYEKQSPDYYLSYSDYWSEYQTYPISSENVTAVGSPYFERQVTKYKVDNSKSNNGKKKVLFISGAAYGKELSKVAVELKKAANDDIEIIYKLHPDEFGFWREWYPNLVEESINVIDSKDVSIYEFFNDADVQVGVFSTALYEALAFDVDTYILNIPFAAEFIQFCKDGYGTLIDNGTDLYEAIINSENDNKMDASSLAEKFWKSNARENVVTAIKEILSK